MTKKWTRTELAARLGISASGVDRLIGAGLRPCGQRGKAKLYHEAAARHAMRRAAATGKTEYSTALTNLFNAQAEEARVREAELRQQHVHESEWTQTLRAEIAAVRGVLADWLPAATERLLAIARPGGPRLFPGDDPRAIGFAVQEREVRPLLDRIATRLGDLDAPEAPAPPPRPAGPTPDTIADARAALIAARGAVAQLRADLKTDPAWRRRAAVEWAVTDARAKARDELATNLPARMVRLAGPAPDAGHVQRELAAIGQAVIDTLEEPLHVRPGRGRDRGENWRPR